LLTDSLTDCALCPIAYSPCSAGRALISTRESNKSGEIFAELFL